MYSTSRKNLLSRKYDELIGAVTRSFKKHPLETGVVVVGASVVSSVIAPVGLLLPATTFGAAARETHNRGPLGYAASVLSGVMAFATITAPFFVQDAYRRPAIKAGIVDLYKGEDKSVERRYDSIGFLHWDPVKDGASVRVERIDRTGNCITVQIEGEEGRNQFCGTANRPEGYEGAETFPALARN